MRLISLVTMLLSLMTASAWSQAPFNACYDRKGQPIPSVGDDALGWGGVATYRNNQRVILWNTKGNQQSSQTSQLLLYLHECAHHNLGHLFEPSSARNEHEADCWAIQLMVDGGMINGHHLAVLEREQVTVRGDDKHVGGKERVQSLQECLDIRTDREEWASAIVAFTGAAPDSFKAIRGRPEEDAEDGLYWSTQDAPGTYDCEVRGTTMVRCMVFAARKPGAARKRYQELMKIIREWLPPTWSSIEKTGGRAPIEQQFLAQDMENDTMLGLLVTSEARVYFVVRRTPVEGF